MSGRIPRLLAGSLPLLGRELVENANRRRTYMVRMLVVLLALIIFGLASSSMRETQGMFGLGDMITKQLVLCQYMVIFLLLPAMAASSLTQEKEQGTLILLLLTPMGPSRLILQKFLSLILMMLALLLGCLPLLGVAYAMGGVSSSVIIDNALGLLLTMVEFAALGLAIGSWCRRSAGATILTYLLVAGMYVIQISTEYYGYTNGWAIAFAWYRDCCPWTFSSLAGMHLLTPGGVIAPLVIACVAVVAARVVLVRRSALEGGHSLLRVLRVLDRTFERLEAKLLKRRRVRELPLDRPIWWLEVNRKSLANLRYLVRIFLPVYGVVFLFATAFPDHADEIYYCCLGFLLLPLVVIHASVLSQERLQQTLEVILSTPLTAMTLLRQKARALARLRWAVSGCLLIPVAIRMGDARYQYEGERLRSAIMVGAALLLPAICCWIALLFGVALNNARRAALASVGICLIWLVGLPILVNMVWQPFSQYQSVVNAALEQAFPIVLLSISHYELENMCFQHEVGLLVTLMVHVGLWWFLRWACLHWGSHRLYRFGAGSAA